MEGDHPRVLVVDDEKEIRDLLQQILHAEGYQVATAESGKEGIERVEAEMSTGSRFDLILIDLVMPEMDGIEVLRTVKQCDPDIGVVMLTGYASVDTAVRSMKLGAYDYIAKPFRMSEIVARLEEALRRHGLALENRELVRRLEERNGELGQLREELERLRSTE